MVGGYPPGVTGNERAIAGPSREEERAEEEATDSFWDFELEEYISDRADEIAEILNKIYAKPRRADSAYAELDKKIDEWLEEHLNKELER